jgi:hypothetical protein
VNSAIRQASDAAHRALDASRRERRSADQRLRILRTIDRVLESLEEVNLSGHGFEPVKGAWFGAVEQATGSELPANVRGASTPVDLHEALLDWQEQLLDRVVPARSTYRDVDTEIDPPEQRRRRRRRRTPAILRTAA